MQENKTKISMIVAADRNNAIGSNNEMAWHLPDDFRNFKAVTLGHSVIMGRLTMESLPFPLPERRNIVLSRHKHLILDGFEHAGSMEEALKMVEDQEKIFIIGGGEIYEAFLPLASEIYKTKVDTEIADADAWFPELEEENWKTEFFAKHPIDEKHKFEFSFNVYSRIE